MGTNKRISIFRLLAYIVVIFTLIISLLFPLTLKWSYDWAILSMVYGNRIVDFGGLTDDTFISEIYSFYKGGIIFEIEYPAPSLLFSIFFIVTNVQREYEMLLPILGLGSLIFFILARFILNEFSDRHDFGLVLAAIYYFFAVSFMDSMSIGRAMLGIVFLTYFTYCYIKFLTIFSYELEQRFSYLVTLFLFTLVTGFTYYTSILAISLGTLFITIMLCVIALLTKKPVLSRAGFSIGILATFLFVKTFQTPLSLALHGKANLAVLISNIIQYVNFLLRYEQNEAYYLWTPFIEVGFPYTILELMKKILWLITIIAVMTTLIAYKNKIFVASPSSRVIEFFSMLVVFFSLSELSYLFILPKSPLRFFVLYGQICLLYILMNVIKQHNGFKLKKLKYIASLIILLLILAVSFGLHMERYQGIITSMKPFAYHEVQPLSEFLCEYSSSEHPIILAGDANYVSNMFFITSLYGKINNVVPEPLDSDAITLYNSLLTGKIENFIASMHKKGISYLMIIKTERPLWGSVLGYAVTLRNIELLSNTSDVDLLYNNGHSQFFKLPQTRL